MLEGVEIAILLWVTVGSQHEIVKIDNTYSTWHERRRKVLKTCVNRYLGADGESEIRIWLRYFVGCVVE